MNFLTWFEVFLISWLSFLEITKVEASGCYCFSCKYPEVSSKYRSCGSNEVSQCKKKLFLSCKYGCYIIRKYNGAGCVCIKGWSGFFCSKPENPPVRSSLQITPLIMASTSTQTNEKVTSATSSGIMVYSSSILPTPHVNITTQFSDDSNSIETSPVPQMLQTKQYQHLSSSITCNQIDSPISHPPLDCHETFPISTTTNDAVGLTGLSSISIVGGRDGPTTMTSMTSKAIFPSKGKINSFVCRSKNC